MANVTKLDLTQNQVSPVQRYLKQFKAWRARRQAMFQLSALSDHLLKDMGIARGEIYDVVKQRSDFVPASKLTRLTPAPIVAEVRTRQVHTKKLLSKKAA